MDELNFEELEDLDAVTMYSIYFQTLKNSEAFAELVEGVKALTKEEVMFVLHCVSEIRKALSEYAEENFEEYVEENFKEYAEENFEEYVEKNLESCAEERMELTQVFLQRVDEVLKQSEHEN